jgi:hypothetical protein
MPELIDLQQAEQNEQKRLQAISYLLQSVEAQQRFLDGQRKDIASKNVDDKTQSQELRDFFLRNVKASCLIMNEQSGKELKPILVDLQHNYCREMLRYSLIICEEIKGLLIDAMYEKIDIAELCMFLKICIKKQEKLISEQNADAVNALKKKSALLFGKKRISIKAPAEKMLDFLVELDSKSMEPVLCDKLSRLFINKCMLFDIDNEYYIGTAVDLNLVSNLSRKLDAVSDRLKKMNTTVGGFFYARRQKFYNDLDAFLTLRSTAGYESIREIRAVGRGDVKEFNGVVFELFSMIRKLKEEAELLISDIEQVIADIQEVVIKELASMAEMFKAEMLALKNIVAVRDFLENAKEMDLRETTKQETMVEEDCLEQNSAEKDNIEKVQKELAEQRMQKEQAIAQRNEVIKQERLKNQEKRHQRRVAAVDNNLKNKTVRQSIKLPFNIILENKNELLNLFDHNITSVTYKEILKLIEHLGGKVHDSTGSSHHKIVFSNYVCGVLDVDENDYEVKPLIHKETLQRPHGHAKDNKIRNFALKDLRESIECVLPDDWRFLLAQNEHNYLNAKVTKA